MKEKKGFLMDIIQHSIRYTDTHVYFFIDDAPFSNFYQTAFVYKGYTLQFSEQGLMIEKAMLFEPSKAEEIANASHPYQAKQLGRSIQNYDDKQWGAVRYDKMVDVLKAKFSQPRLKEILLETGNRIIVEGSPYDRIWGVKIDWQDDRILNETNWKGQNLLGEALMEVRDYYRHEQT